MMRQGECHWSMMRQGESPNTIDYSICVDADVNIQALFVLGYVIRFRCEDHDLYEDFWVMMSLISKNSQSNCNLQHTEGKMLKLIMRE